MDAKEKAEKNKQALGAIITIVGIGLIVIGIVTGLNHVPESLSTGFFMCLAGTVLTFVGNYFRNGYIKFFN